MALDAVVIDPLRLVISQPHQAFISTGSVALVAMEAGHMVDAPWSVLMAIGAEWAYLKGISTRAKVQTPWNSRLINAAVLLVVVYGFLAGARKFGVPLPDEGFQATDVWSIVGVVVLTLVHIVCIGAVTLCSGMIHRAALDAEQAEQTEQEKRNREREERLQAERDAMHLEAERKEQELAYWVKAQEAKARARGLAQPAAKAQTARPPCPKCNQELDSSDYALMRSADKRGARFNGCKTCRAA
jgi:DNA-directed RNA polymerase subunit M/transcription elongation factor TFIIS